MNSFKSLWRDAGLEPLDAYLGALLSAFGLALYLSFPSRCYVLEGLARAIPMELGLFKSLLLGNYLLYGVLGNLFFHGLQALGYAGPAYMALQTMNGLLGAAGLLMFYLLVRTAGVGRYYAAMGTLMLSLSLGYWMWSTEAENYILSTVLLQLNFFALLLHAKTGRPSPWVLGVLQALAMFGHLVNGLFGCVGLWILVSTHGREWKKAVWPYILACVVVWGIAYGSALAVLKPASLLGAVQWILGSAAGDAGHMSWHGSWWSWDSVRLWAVMSVRIVRSLQDSVFTNPPAWRFSALVLRGVGMVLAAVVAGGLWRSATVWKEHRLVVTACLIWLGLYGLVFSSWEPHTMVYRVSDLVPLMIVVTLLAQACPIQGVVRPLFCALVIGLGLGNGGAEASPRSHWENNPTWVSMQFIKASTEDSAWIIGNHGLDNIYLPYFAERRPLVVNSFQSHPQDLQRHLERLWAAQVNVYATSPVLADPFWADFFKAYRVVPVAQGPTGITLSRIIKK